MQRPDFSAVPGSLARTVEVVGASWSPLILNEIWAGTSRFDDLQRNLGISRKVLTARLKTLVDYDVVDRRPYDNRPRYEYLLTEKGTELVDLLLVMTAWGDRWHGTNIPPQVSYRHRSCGQVGRAELRCTSCGGPMHGAVDVVHGGSD
jgi:DNA-binding HxlR family transcriptional regulator